MGHFEGLGSILRYKSFCFGEKTKQVTDYPLTIDILTNKMHKVTYNTTHLIQHNLC